MATLRFEWIGGRLFEVSLRGVRCEVNFIGYACCLACYRATGGHVVIAVSERFFCLTCRNRRAMHDFRDWIVDSFEESKRKRRKRKEEP